MTLGFLAGQDYDNRTQQRIAKDKPLGDWSEVADYAGRLIPNIVYVAGMYSAYWFTENDAYKKHGVIMIKASAYSVGVSTIFKVVVKEQRPNKGKDRTSFPSGHATTVFAFASAVSAEHGFWPFGLGATMLATLTAIGRLNDNMHHGHDVIAGATIGTAFGLGVSHINAAFDKKEMDVAILPIINEDFTGLNLVYNFE